MKKVLIITYYWPPSGGGGVQRWLKFAKYLPEFGWEPIIYTPENPSFDLKDNSLEAEVNSATEVLKLPIWEPYGIFEKLSGRKTPSQGLTMNKKRKSLIHKLALWVRGNFFIPDPRKFWIRRSVQFLNTIIKENGIDTIISTGPPHSMHLIAHRLRKKNNVRWVADFRDPWSRWDMLENFHLSLWARWRHRQLEKKVLQLADEVMTVSHTWKNEFEAIHPRPYHVITNGFDETDFSQKPDEHNSSKFIIGHFGLLNGVRNPENFWTAVQDFKHVIDIQLTGTIDAEVAAIIQNDPVLNEMVHLHPPLSHQAVIKQYGKVDLLILILNKSNNAKGHIPGKLFEYIASQRPILALGPADGDAAAVIAQTNTGRVVHWDDTIGIKKALQQLMNDPFQPDELAIKKYTRKQLTKQLVTTVLEGVHDN